MTKFLNTLIVLPFAAAILWLHGAKGVSFDYFIYGSGSWDIVAFGVGIGAIEAFLVATPSTSVVFRGAPHYSPDMC